MNGPLVSVITACWNGERYIDRYFENILAQTYNDIELIFVNNGSIDRTGEIANDYRSKLEKRGIIYKYIYLKKNAYTGGAKLLGLKMFSGEYFFCPDSDDILHPDHIEKKVQFLENNKEYGLVVCQLRVVNEENLDVGVGILKRDKPQGEDKHFEDLIRGINVVYTGCAFMMRRSIFLKINPERDIYVSPYGENFQILLPFLYKSKCGYLDKVIGDYVVRSDSFTNTVYAEKRIESFSAQEIIISETLNRIKPDNMQYYLDISTNKYMRARFRHACVLKDMAQIQKYYIEMKNAGKLSLADRIEYIACYSKIMSNALTFCRKMKSCLNY